MAIGMVKSLAWSTVCISILHTEESRGLGWGKDIPRGIKAQKTVNGCVLRISVSRHYLVSSPCYLHSILLRTTTWSMRRRTIQTGKR